ncbi:type 1 glutamine amidotransferase domain-containing protein [Paeniroseomonas aquatica]|uniref:type 1 glutamine amidotransferase domain-containing protein n=1 Tax=Paeniroseomonas aquatica TaxID=373043 RepID=UPI003608A4D8
MAGELNGRSVAVLATDGVEQVELTEPVKALKAAGAKVVVVAPKPGTIQGWNHMDKGDAIPVDQALDQVDPAGFDALLLPGGVVNPDQLRLEPKAIDFIRHFVQAKKPIAAICHGPWTLIDAGGVSGRRMTSWPSLKADLGNAGAQWEDSEVVTDRGLVTSRKPDDIPAFNRKMIEESPRAATTAEAAPGAPAEGALASASALPRAGGPCWCDGSRGASPCTRPCVPTVRC